MQRKRVFRLVTPRVFDERAQSLQLFVIRDTCVAVLLMAVVFVTCLAFAPVFVKAHLGEIGGIAVVSAGLVTWISNALRKGRDMEQKKLFAKGDLLAAPFLAASVAFLITMLIGIEVSLLEWLLFFGVMLLGFLVYPLFILRHGRKHTAVPTQPPPYHSGDSDV